MLEEFGYNKSLELYRKENKLESFAIGRVISEHKDRYQVKSETGEFESELLGNLRYNAESREDLPAVGDWVAISEYDHNKALIHSIYPRFSCIGRHAVGSHGKFQIIAANIDVALIVQSANQDFNINRLERYLSICQTSKITPIIVLSKTDLIDSETCKSLIDQIKKRIKHVEIISTRNDAADGYSALSKQIVKGKTYCLLGSSGVGKSTLLNSLSGENSMATGEISEHVGKGKHVTTHRELILLANGGIMIDNPGMREVGITGSGEGLEQTFEYISDLSDACKYRDCSHSGETDCAIQSALNSGELDQDSYTNFIKMEKEKAHYESSALERKQKDKSMTSQIKKALSKKHNQNY